jgi:hypothetical protein
MYACTHLDPRFVPEVRIFTPYVRRVPVTTERRVIKALMQETACSYGW